MLRRFDPFRDVDHLWAGGASRPAIPMDALRRGDHVEVYLDLPGIDPDSVDITVERNRLTVEAERQLPPSDDDVVLVRERRQGAFRRQLSLGETLDAGSVDASYENGVLTLRIPVAETAKPRKISVGVGSSHDAIEAETTDS